MTKQQAENKRIYKIDLIIINEILKESERELFSMFDVFKILKKYLYPEEIMELLEIGRSSYYAYNRKASANNFVERKLYEFYLSIKY